MASQQFDLDGVGSVIITKRASSRNIRLSIRSDGQVMVSIPSWASFRAGRAFAESKRSWLQRHVRPPKRLQDGQTIGKSHTLALLPTTGLKAPRTMVSRDRVIVRYPAELPPEGETVQLAAESACIRALRKQAENLLPDRLAELAMQHDFIYRSVRIKRLKGRWGSCDSQQNIVFNLFLMELPWECIDYVILHELTHTKVLRHGPPFWEHMEQVLPNVKAVRQRMRAYQPVLQSDHPAVQ